MKRFLIVLTLVTPLTIFALSADAPPATSKFTFDNVKVVVTDQVRNPAFGLTPTNTLEMALAAAAAWQKYNSGPTTITINFIPHFINDDGSVDSWTHAAFFPATGVIDIAEEHLLELFSGADLETTLVLVASHEVTHQVQAARGGPMPPSDRNHYENDTREFEAWDNAVDVTKFVLAGTSGSFQFGGRTFTIPEKTSITHFRQ